MLKSYDRWQKKNLSLEEFKQGSVINGNNDICRIIGKGTINLDDGRRKIPNIILVEGLKPDLLSVGKMVDQGYDLIFNFKWCEIRKIGSRRLLEMQSGL